MSKNIKSVIKKRQKLYIIQRFERDYGYYDEDGDFISEDLEKEYINLHIQPIERKINTATEGQRIIIDYKCFTIENIREKDKIIINDEIFTVNNLKIWDGIYTECTLIRSGESDNINDQ